MSIKNVFKKILIVFAFFALFSVPAFAQGKLDSLTIDSAMVNSFVSAGIASEDDVATLRTTLPRTIKEVDIVKMQISKEITPAIGAKLLQLFFLPDDVAENTESGNGSGNKSSASGESITLKNPLASGNVQDIPTLVKKILEIVLKIGAPLIALALIYSGYLFIAAQGNATKLKTAKDTLIYVVIGAAILLGAYVIAESIVGTVNAIRGNQ